MRDWLLNLLNPYYNETNGCATDKFVLLEDIEQTYMGRTVVRTIEKPVDKQTVDNLLSSNSITYCGFIVDGYGCNQYRYRRK